MGLQQRRIFLIGMMGSGKSYWAGKLGHYFGVPSFDLDRLIEQDTRKTIRQIFAAEGESFFRETESRLLRSSLPLKGFVMATGGGTPCFNDNMAFMKQNGLVVWLNPSLNELIERVSRSIDTRPVLQGISNTESLKLHLEKLMEKRRGWYAAADLTIDDDTVPENVVEKINAFTKTMP